MLPERVESLVLQPEQRGMQTDDSGEVGRAGLEAIRHEVRKLLRVADASGTSGNQWLYQRDHLRGQQESADALGTKKSLVAGEAECVDVHLFHVDGEEAGSLCGIGDELQAMKLTEFADFPVGHERAAYIAGMHQDDSPGGGSEERFHAVRYQCSIGFAGNAAEGDTPPG